MIKLYPYKKEIYAAKCSKCKSYVVYDKDETFHYHVYDCNVFICPRCKSFNKHLESNILNKEELK